MPTAAGMRRILLLAAGAAGLSVFLLGGRSCFRPSAPKEHSDSAPAASSRDPQAPRAAPAHPPGGAARKPAQAAHPAVAREDDALDEALRIEDPILRSMEFGRLFAEREARNPAAALAYLQAMDRDGNEYALALFATLKDIGQRDPRRALALAKILAVTSEQRVVYSILFDQFAAEHAADAVPLLDLVPAGEARNNAVRALTTRWADQDVESALAWAQRLGNAEDRGPAVESVLFKLAENEPWRAFAVAAQNLDGDALERIVSLVFKQLKTIDPDQAADFVRWLPAGETQTHVMLDLARAMAERDPASALDWSGSLPTDEQRQLALRNVLDVWLAKSPGAASDYVSKMPRGDAQNAAAAHVAEQLAVQDAAAAVRFAQGLKSASARQAASVALASGWARQDPAAAVRWAVGLEEGDAARGDALDAALSYWVLSDSPAAVRCVRRLPAGKIQDDGLDALSELLGVQQPALAVELASAIGNPKLRNAALVLAYEQWAGRDAAAARQWLEGADLSSALRHRLSGN